jgi:histo-blood group ABO system transferase
LRNNTALLVIATGKAYHEYAENLIDSARRFFPTAHILVFTDAPTSNKFDAAYATFFIDAKGYPNETLHRYHTFLSKEPVLSHFDYLWYCDADMEFVAPVGDIFPPASAGLVATLHPGFVGLRGTPETRVASTAFCNYNKAYYCGGFQGGEATAYLGAMAKMASNIDADTKSGITAVWHDESHWNRFLADNPPAKVLTPSYCYPEGYSGEYRWQPRDYEPILMALDKRRRGDYRSQR